MLNKVFRTRITLALFVLLVLIGAAKADQIAPSAIFVVDGDTVRAEGKKIRLVGFDTPEAGDFAQCRSERRLARRASTRLRQIIKTGNLDLRLVHCSCPPGTEGTTDCSYGRACGILTAQGRDVGDILISEGLARPYHCGQTNCPPRTRWCP